MNKREILVSRPEANENNGGYSDELMEKFGKQVDKQSRIRIREIHPQSEPQNTKEMTRRERDRSKNIDRESSSLTVKEEARAGGLPEKNVEQKTAEQIAEKAERQVRNNPEKFMSSGFADALRDGVAVEANQAVVDGYERYAWRNGENDHTATGEHIADAIQNNPEGVLDSETIKNAKKKAFLDALHLGALYEEGENGEIEPVFTIPEKVKIIKHGESKAISRFLSRYGEQYDNNKTVDSAEYIEENGLELDSDETRQASYSGFFRVAEAITDNPEIGTSQLEWYYNNLHYGEHLEELEEYVKLNIDRNPRATKLIEQFLVSKGEYAVYLASEDEEESEIASGEYEVVDFVDGVPDDDDLKATAIIETAREYVSGFFGVEMDEKELAKMIKQVNVKLGFTSGTGSPHSYGSRDDEESMKKRTARRERDILTEAKKLALLAEYKIITESGIDPGAEILVPKEGNQSLSGAQYMILRFGCDGKNHVIAEELSRNGSLYAWYGEGDEGYKDVFCTGKTKQQAKTMPGVRAFQHRGMNNGLHAVHQAVMAHFADNGALSPQNRDRILRIEPSN